LLLLCQLHYTSNMHKHNLFFEELLGGGEEVETKGRAYHC